MVPWVCGRVCYTLGHAQASTKTDRSILQEIWDANPLMRQYLGSLDNPQLIVCRITPTRVRFMREWALEYHEVPI